MSVSMSCLRNHNAQEPSQKESTSEDLGCTPYCVSTSDARLNFLLRAPARFCICHGTVPTHLVSRVHLLLRLWSPCIHLTGLHHQSSHQDHRPTPPTTQSLPECSCFSCRTQIQRPPLYHSRHQSFCSHPTL